MWLWILFIISAIVLRNAQEKMHHCIFSEKSQRRFFFTLSVVSAAIALGTAIIAASNGNFIILYISGDVAVKCIDVEMYYDNYFKKGKMTFLKYWKEGVIGITLLIGLIAIYTGNFIDFIITNFFRVFGAYSITFEYAIICAFFIINLSFLKVMSESELFRSYINVWVIMPIMIVANLAIPLGLEQYINTAVNSASYTETSMTREWELTPIKENGKIIYKDLENFKYVEVSHDGKSYTVNCLIDNDRIRKDDVWERVLEVDATTIYVRDDCVPYIVEYTTTYYIDGVMKAQKHFYEIYTTTGTIYKVPDKNSQ